VRKKSRRLKRQREEEERIKDRDLFKTVEEVFDSFTMGHVYRLMKKGLIWDLKGVVSSGKEARVYWGVNREKRDVAVKIYLTATAEFRKSIKKYVIGDPRLEEAWRGGNFRTLIYEWTRKEYRNLRRMREAGVRVPEPLGFSGNVLVMEFLGEKGYRAPLLHEAAASLPAEELARIYDDVALQVRSIVCEARLVHADLSEYNIMLWDGKPWIIDVAQAVHVQHPLAREFLERDIANITRFFEGVLGDHEPPEYLKEAAECLA